MHTFAYKANVKNAELTPGIRKEFHGFHIYPKSIFLDKKGSREGFDRMCTRLETGDLVILDSLLSLGSSNKEIAKNWDLLRNKKHVNIKVLDTELLDTRIRVKDIPDTLFVDAAMEIFAGVTEKTDKIRKSKQRDGIDEAQRSGIRFGRPRMELPEEFDHYASLYKEGKITLKEAAEKVGVNKSTFSYRLRADAAKRGQ